MQVSRLASCFSLQAQSSSPTSAPAAICSISTHFFRATPSFSLKRQAFFKSRPQECYFCSLNNPCVESPKLPAPRADVTAAGRARPRGFVLLRRLRLLPLPKSARRHPFSALAVPAPLPHVGATSGFESSGGYALGWAAKAAQTADTGATGCDWRFGCAINLCFQ